VYINNIGTLQVYMTQGSIGSTESKILPLKKKKKKKKERKKERKRE
jgi:hypothetical protein